MLHISSSPTDGSRYRFDAVQHLGHREYEKTLNSSQMKSAFDGIQLKKLHHRRSASSSSWRDWMEANQFTLHVAIIQS